MDEFISSLFSERYTLNENVRKNLHWRKLSHASYVWQWLHRLELYDALKVTFEFEEQLLHTR